MKHLTTARRVMMGSFFAALVLLCPGAGFAAEGAVKKLLIVWGEPDGHPPTTHEFKADAEVLAELLKPYKGIEATVVKADGDWPAGPSMIDGADGVTMSITQGSEWMQINKERHAALKRLAARGGAITALHWSVGAKDGQWIAGQLELLGATRGGENRKYTKSQATLLRPNPNHPIVTGVPDIPAYDEWYYSLDRVPGIVPLLTANIDGKDEMISWAWERPDGGRSFGFDPLHYHSNWQKPEYRRYIVQGHLWALKQPIPAGGVNVDIDSKKLELNGVLPPPAAPGVEKPAKKTEKKPKKESGK